MAAKGFDDFQNDSFKISAGKSFPLHDHLDNTVDKNVFQQDRIVVCAKCWFFCIFLDESFGGKNNNNKNMVNY